MLNIRLPHNLMVHSLDHYTTSTSIDSASGEEVLTYTLANESVPCNFQQAPADVVEIYKQKQRQITAVAYLLNSAVYAAIGPDDKIVFNTIDYEVRGKQDLCNLNKVFRIDLGEAL